MIYGAIFGDIAGSAYEFNPVENRDFEMIVPKSRFTDDTVMTLAIANWLMENPDDEDVLIKQMQTLGAFYPGAGYGPSFAHWLISLNPQPYNSWGNGSAMRVSPCGWVAKTLAEAEELAKKSAEVTHNHPEGIKGAQAVAAAIWMARNNYSKQEIKDEYKQIIDLSIEDDRIRRYLKGETLDVDDLVKNKDKGWYLVCVDGYPLGFGKLSNGTLKNKYLPGWRLN